MKNLEKKLRNKVQKIPDKRIRRLLIVSGMLALFAFFDIETLKKIELWGISGIANTVDSVAAPILDIFENGCVKTFVYMLFGFLLLLWIYKSTIHPKAIIISHSSFSNDQSSYDPSIVSGYSVKEKDINLVNHMAQHNIVDAIRIQDTLIKEALNDCDKSTELFYYGIAHIPLIFRAGFQVGDEGMVRLLHKFRNGQPLFKEISSDQDTCTVRLKFSPVRNNKVSNEMLVVVATSLPIVNEDLVVFRDGDLRCELHFAMASKSMYGFDSVDSYAIMNRLRKGILDKIRETVTKENITRIHMVLAASSDFTFFLAQGFSKNHDPEVIVYHYDRNATVKYPWGISNILSPTNAVVRQGIILPDK